MKKTLKELAASLLAESMPFGPNAHDDTTSKMHLEITPSLLIRLFEYFNENELEDEDLHDIVELMTDRSVDGYILSMDDYDYIVGNDLGESINEDTTEEIKHSIIHKHAAGLPDSAIDHLKKQKTFGKKVAEHLMDNHGVSAGKALSITKNISSDIKSRLGNSSATMTQSQRVDRYLKQKHIGPR